MLKHVIGVLIVGWGVSCAQGALATSGEAPVDPGLWHMVVDGEIVVPQINLTQPVHRTTQLCVHKGSAATDPFLPQHHQQCTTHGTPAGNGRENWEIDCVVPGATVQETGWIESSSHALRSHWRILARTGNASGAVSSQTTMDMNGTWVATDCGQVP